MKKEKNLNLHRLISLNVQKQLINNIICQILNLNPTNLQFRITKILGLIRYMPKIQKPPMCLNLLNLRNK